MHLLSPARFFVVIPSKAESLEEEVVRLNRFIRNPSLSEALALRCNSHS